METPGIDLDDRAALEAVDRSDMLSVLGRFPQQVREALDIGASDLELPPGEGVDSVVVLGMGGSGVSGDVVASIVSGELAVPFATLKGYGVPAFVGANTLVFAVSYSGNTEETLECLGQSCERGARVVCVTSGGRLAQLAESRSLPAFRIPGGLQPRASLGYLFVPIICALERMGLARGKTETLGAAAGMLDERSAEYGPDHPLDGNPTKRLARDLDGFLPVIYGSEGPLAVVATRWKTQLNENSKVPAFSHSFPELNHNETVGWEHLEDIEERCHLVVLRQQGEHPRIERRIGITMDLIGDRLGRTTQVCARGSNAVERMLDLIYFGDYTSVYLALAMGQDPTPVVRIEELKKKLAEGR